MANKEQQQLKELYSDSLEEREALRLVSDVQIIENRKQMIELCDFDRREQVDALMQDIPMKSKLDYFYAAMIYAHGETVADYKKTNHYAEQALNFNDENKLSTEDEQQLTAVYEQSFDQCQVAEGKTPKYSTKQSSDASEDESRLKATQAPMLKPF